MKPKQVVEHFANEMASAIEDAMAKFVEGTGYDVEITGDSKMKTTTYNKSVRYKLAGDAWK